MEPTGDQPDDDAEEPHRDALALAAMEPAENRPDDTPIDVGTTGTSPPQWSRPRIGRMTSA
jgi:hypothetical protein